MPIQSDLELAMKQLEGLSPMTLSLYAYAAYKLLCEKRPLEVKNGSFEVYISNMPEYSKDFEREIPMDLNAKITVSEAMTCLQ